MVMLARSLALHPAARWADNNDAGLIFQVRGMSAARRDQASFSYRKRGLGRARQADRASRQMVKDDWISEGENWLLLTKHALPGA